MNVHECLGMPLLSFLFCTGVISMGCGSSRNVAVSPMPVPKTQPSNHEAKECLHMSCSDNSSLVKIDSHKEEKGSTVTSSIITVKEVQGSCDSMVTESHYSSSESIPEYTKTVSNSSNNSRDGSAKSNDSGLGEGYHSIITENSSSPLRKLANMPGDIPEPDLSIDGKKIKTPGPIGHRKRSTGRLPPVHPKNKKSLEERSVLEKDRVDPLSLEAILQKRVKFADVLIDELPASSDIIKRPVSRGGIAFDIVSGEETHRKPPCVLKYAQRKRAAEVVTHSELDEKLRAADQRRKVSYVATYTRVKSAILGEYLQLTMTCLHAQNPISWS